MVDIQKEREDFEIHCHDYGLDNEKDEDYCYRDYKQLVVDEKTFVLVVDTEYL